MCSLLELQFLLTPLVKEKRIVKDIFDYAKPCIEADGYCYECLKKNDVRLIRHEECYKGLHVPEHLYKGFPMYEFLEDGAEDKYPFVIKYSSDRRQPEFQDDLFHLIDLTEEYFSKYDRNRYFMFWWRYMLNPDRGRKRLEHYLERLKRIKKTRKIDSFPFKNK